MSYRLSKFGTTSLPCARMTATYGTGPTVDATIPTIGGMYDAYAGGIGNLAVPYEITHGCWIVDTEANAQTTLEDLYGMRGERRILYRTDEYDLSVHWCWARCTQVRNPWQWQRKTMNPLDIVFQIQSPWYGVVYGTGWSIANSSEFAKTKLLVAPVTYTLDFASNTFTVNNPGNVTTRMVSARVTPAGLSLSNMSIAVGDCHIIWAGDLGNGENLDINGNTMSITNDGVNAYTELAYGSAHRSGWWLELEPGDNTVTVTRTVYGGIGEVRLVFDFAAGWA